MCWLVTLSATFKATYSILFPCFSADKGDTVQEAMCARLIAFCMGERALARFLFENYLHFIYNVAKKKRNPILLYEPPQNIHQLIQKVVQSHNK